MGAGAVFEPGEEQQPQRLREPFLPMTALLVNIRARGLGFLPSFSLNLPVCDLFAKGFANSHQDARAHARKRQRTSNVRA